MDSMAKTTGCIAAHPRQQAHPGPDLHFRFAAMQVSPHGMPLPQCLQHVFFATLWARKRSTSVGSSTTDRAVANDGTAKSMKAIASERISSLKPAPQSLE